jgi:anti-sigma factor RsiW
MNDCGQRHLLAAYRDGELDVAAAARFEGHLVDCAACRSELDRIESGVPARTVRPAAEDDPGTMRVATTLLVLAASVMMVGLVWLRVLTRESSSPAPAPAPTMVSLPRSAPGDRAWERVAMTLQPDPLSLPPSAGGQTATAAALEPPDLADWMLQGLVSGPNLRRGERTQQR